MTVRADNLLESLGYKVDKKGNINPTTNQLAIVSLETTFDGGIIRIHGDSSSFFYRGDELIDDLILSFPSKISERFVYFEGAEEGYKISKKEFTESLLDAFVEYQKTVKRNFAG